MDERELAISGYSPSPFDEQRLARVYRDTIRVHGLTKEFFNQEALDHIYWLGQPLSTCSPTWTSACFVQLKGLPLSYFDTGRGEEEQPEIEKGYTAGHSAFKFTNGTSFGNPNQTSCTHEAGIRNCRIHDCFCTAREQHFWMGPQWPGPPMCCRDDPMTREHRNEYDFLIPEKNRRKDIVHAIKRAKTSEEKCLFLLAEEAGVTEEAWLAQVAAALFPFPKAVKEHLKPMCVRVHKRCGNVTVTFRLLHKPPLSELRSYPSWHLLPATHQMDMEAAFCGNWYLRVLSELLRATTKMNLWMHGPHYLAQIKSPLCLDFNPMYAQPANPEVPDWDPLRGPPLEDFPHLLGEPQEEWPEWADPEKEAFWDEDEQGNPEGESGGTAELPPLTIEQKMEAAHIAVNSAEEPPWLFQGWKTAVYPQRETRQQQQPNVLLDQAMPQKELKVLKQFLSILCPQSLGWLRMSDNINYIEYAVWSERARDEANMNLPDRFHEARIASMELNKELYSLTLEQVREWACAKIRHRLRQQEQWLTHLIQTRGNEDGVIIKGWEEQL